MSVYTKVVLVALLAGAFSVGGALAVTSVGAATSLEDAASRSENNTYTGVVNAFTKGVKIGVQGSGGVTYFNGTIINTTTDEAGLENPVTFGDDVRVDGKMMRGPWYNEQPLWIADDIQVDGDITQGRLNEGIPKATVVVSNGGAVARSADNTSDGSMGVTVSKAATGTYSVVFDSDVTNRYVLVSPRGSSTAPTAASGVINSNGRIVTVYIADVIAGVLVDQAFTIAVF